MARKTFFSFHYERDAWRAANVRNSGVLSNDDEFGFIDAAAWEKIEREGDAAIKRWIQEQLKSTTVTAVLIGAETASREWVKYEIRESWKRGNAIIGVRIHGIKDQDSKADSFGANPLDVVKFDDGTTLSTACKTYDWVADKGREHLGEWLEEAVQAREDMAEAKVIEELAKKASTYTTVAGPSIIQNPPKPWAY
ncbi:TIR domain-containing protein [Bradyrhizobium sp. Ec3.3]|uniref:TIR domain-containing protein n=1 Tax=Bradyrhizobium sp. Ec3.3 TaxID=189753 RepID=UPI00041BA504|nr:TIR domain-containing protein [Bradyrhizobium sp. Ec3.3]